MNEIKEDYNSRPVFKGNFTNSVDIYFKWSNNRVTRRAKEARNRNFLKGKYIFVFGYLLNPESCDGGGRGAGPSDELSS